MATTQKKKTRWSLRAVIAGYCLVMVYLLGTMYFQNGQLQAQQELNEQYQQQIEELTKAEKQLQQQKAFADTDEYVEQQAREKFNFVLPGEIRFVPIEE